MHNMLIVWATFFPHDIFSETLSIMQKKNKTAFVWKNTSFTYIYRKNWLIGRWVGSRKYSKFCIFWKKQLLQNKKLSLNTWVYKLLFISYREDEDNGSKINLHSLYPKYLDNHVILRINISLTFVVLSLYLWSPYSK